MRGLCGCVVGLLCILAWFETGSSIGVFIEPSQKNGLQLRLADIHWHGYYQIQRWGELIFHPDPKKKRNQLKIALYPNTKLRQYYLSSLDNDKIQFTPKSSTSPKLPAWTTKELEDAIYDERNTFEFVWSKFVLGSITPEDYHRKIHAVDAEESWTEINLFGCGPLFVELNTPDNKPALSIYEVNTQVVTLPLSTEDGIFTMHKEDFFEIDVEKDPNRNPKWKKVEFRGLDITSTYSRWYGHTRRLYKAFGNDLYWFQQRLYNSQVRYCGRGISKKEIKNVECKPIMLHQYPRNCVAYEGNGPKEATQYEFSIAPLVEPVNLHKKVIKKGDVMYMKWDKGWCECQYKGIDKQRKTYLWGFQCTKGDTQNEQCEINDAISARSLRRRLRQQEVALGWNREKKKPEQVMKIGAWWTSEHKEEMAAHVLNEYDDDISYWQDLYEFAYDLVLQAFD